jgi:hypothetical protein
MSLDVYLTLDSASIKPGSGIFVREEGQTKEISREEWDERYPGREPAIAQLPESDEVYWANITHNLNKMAGAAGLYEYLWRPDELGIEQAYELILPLEADPDKFRKYNPSNGWGDYDGLVKFVRGYLDACKRYPQARVRVSR